MGDSENGQFGLPRVQFGGWAKSSTCARNQAQALSRQERIAPRAGEIDRSMCFPRELSGLGDLACLGGMTVESGLRRRRSLANLAHISAMEEISRASWAVGLSLRRARVEFVCFNHGSRSMLRAAET